MSRWEFMRRLEELLSDISPNEREEALQYYNDYFNDAGKENEQSVMEALGSPEQVAKIVKEGLSGAAGQGEFTEHGFTSDSARQKKNEVIRRSGEEQTGESADAHSAKEGFEEGHGYSTDNGSSKKGTQMPAWAIVLIVIACVICSPVILGVAVSILGLLLGIAGAILGVIAGFGAAALVLYVVAVVLFIGGFGCMIAAPVKGIGMIGGGCICAAIGILFMLLTVFIAGKCVPGICQGIGYIFTSLFGKKKGAEA